jgi:tRNA uridine 5-carboxymethylaminomethyl modification enzyme
LRRPGARLEHLIDQNTLQLASDRPGRDLDIASVETTVKYEGYLKQEASRAARIARTGARKIPRGFPFAKVPGLSNEVVHRLTQANPATLGLASRVPGMTPAAVSVLAAFLDRASELAPPAS